MPQEINCQRQPQGKQMLPKALNDTYHLHKFLCFQSIAQTLTIIINYITTCKVAPFQGAKAHTTCFLWNSEGCKLQSCNGSRFFGSADNTATTSKSVHESALNLSVSVEAVSLAGITSSHIHGESDQKLLNTHMRNRKSESSPLNTALFWPNLPTN